MKRFKKKPSDGALARVLKILGSARPAGERKLQNLSRDGAILKNGRFLDFKGSVKKKLQNLVPKNKVHNRAIAKHLKGKIYPIKASPEDILFLKRQGVTIFEFWPGPAIGA